MNSLISKFSINLRKKLELKCISYLITSLKVKEEEEMQIEHTAVWVNDLERMKSFTAD